MYQTEKKQKQIKNEANRFIEYARSLQWRRLAARHQPLQQGCDLPLGKKRASCDMVRFALSCCGTFLMCPSFGCVCVCVCVCVFARRLMPPSGSIHDQLAVIKYKNSYYSLSLRMMKAIYRHVRLYKGFKNMENVNGIIKQRIPELLLREKIRTQSRFDV
jgi:hypothetical protein